MGIKVTDYVAGNEGFEQFPYRCTGNKLSIGHGFNIEDCGIPLKVSRYWLEHLILEASDDLVGIFGDCSEWGENRFNALVDMRYQMGRRGFRGFKKMIEAVRRGDWEAAANECMDSEYGRGKTRNRAKRNADMLRRGDGRE